MNKQEQISFVDELITNVKKEILIKMNKNNLPETWDGLELRQLIADEFNYCVIKGVISRKRKIDYNNYRMVHNF